MYCRPPLNIHDSIPPPPLQQKATPRHPRTVQNIYHHLVSHLISLSWSLPARLPISDCSSLQELTQGRNTHITACSPLLLINLPQSALARSGILLEVRPDRGVCVCVLEKRDIEAPWHESWRWERRSGVWNGDLSVVRRRDGRSEEDILSCNLRRDCVDRISSDKTRLWRICGTEMYCIGRYVSMISKLNCGCKQMWEWGERTGCDAWIAEALWNMIPRIPRCINVFLYHQRLPYHTHPHTTSPSPHLTLSPC